MRQRAPPQGVQPLGQEDGDGASSLRRAAEGERVRRQFESPTAALLRAVAALIICIPLLASLFLGSRAVVWVARVVHGYVAYARHPVVEGNPGIGPPPPVPGGCIVMLARSADWKGAASSVAQFEERFNKHHHYPYVFLNDVYFSWNFIQELNQVTKSKTTFGVVPPEHWDPPEWINNTRAEEVQSAFWGFPVSVAASQSRARHTMAKKKPWIPYGGSASYRRMCRFFSGFFFKHPLLAGYKYYMRIEPDVSFHCAMQSDPFQLLHDNPRLSYGWNIMQWESAGTIDTLGWVTRDWAAAHPQWLAPNNSMAALFTGKDGGYKNGAHFWSNFEVGRLSFFRSEAYRSYFDTLDRAGGFFYERWGDAPVHTLAAAMLLDRSQIWFFNDVGYTHSTITHCPQQQQYRTLCECDPGSDWNTHSYTAAIYREFAGNGPDEVPPPPPAQ